jgi:hypothetical protein
VHPASAARVAVAAVKLTPKVAPLLSAAVVQVVVPHVETVEGDPVKWGSTSSIESVAVISFPYVNVNVTSVAVPTACWLNVTACVNDAVIIGSERDIGTADTAGDPPLNATVYALESDGAGKAAIFILSIETVHGVWAARVAVCNLKQTAKLEPPPVPDFAPESQFATVVVPQVPAVTTAAVVANPSPPSSNVGSVIVNAVLAVISSSNVNANVTFLLSAPVSQDENVSESS